MIILGKDKVDERYNIDDNGIITDLQGNVQKTYLNHERPVFHKIGIHKIQMWTKFGWRDGRTWAIHHIDENKLNNSIDNLEFKTRSEHTSLHNKKFKKAQIPWNKNKKGVQICNEETKRKMSESHKGKKHFYYGKHRSEETKRKISETLKRKKAEKNLCLT